MKRVLIAGYLVVVVVHGLIHLMGSVEAYGGDVPQLTEPVSPLLGALWLVAALLVLAGAGLVVLRHRWWPLATVVAAATSQAMVLTTWTDAKAGTIANVLMLVAAAYGWLSRDRHSGAGETQEQLATVSAM